MRSGRLQSEVTPSFPVTRTRSRTSSRGANSANGQSTSTEALPSTVAVWVPEGVVSSSSALRCVQAGTSVAVRQLTGGRATAT